MNQITLYPPEVVGHEVRFRWHVEPRTPLYTREEFTLRFPESIDLAPLPDALWWSAALTCLHSHWPLLRPCRVRLPVRLAPGTVECWSRLLDAEIATLEAYRGTNDTARQIEIIEDGPPLAVPRRLPAAGRCATSFSGGKDSLLQTGLLAELTPRPVLVAVTSPMPPMADHLTPRRRHVLESMPKRRHVDLVEVISDYRANWNNNFARDRGYPVSINEITDTFLYTAALQAAGTALGAGHLFLASETEVQENALHRGRIVQYPHYMYSAVTQRALQSLLAPLGVHYGSLTWPLHSFQVQELLWTRYRDLRDLQYSCWRVADNEATCSRCPQCLRIACTALALGDQPQHMGIDLVTLLKATADWAPECEPPEGDALPRQVVRARLHAQLVRSIQSTPPRRVLAAIAFGQPGRLLNQDGWAAVGAYRRLRRRLASFPAGPRPGYRAGYLRFVDPLLRDRVGEIFATHFPAEEEANYADVLARGDALARWITAPLAAATAKSA
jgi:hypothetical protein